MPGFLAATPEGHVTLAPLHADEGQQSWRAAVLRESLGLEAGEPWRLVLPAAWVSQPAPASSIGSSGALPESGDRPSSEDALALGTLAVVGGASAATPGLDGQGLQPFIVLDGLPASNRGPLLRALRRVEALEDGRVAIVLWGRLPSEPVVRAGERRHALRPTRLAEELEAGPSVPLSAVQGGGESASTELPSRAALLAENERLRHALDEERARRGERERAWYDFNRTLAELRIAPADMSFEVDEDLVPEAAQERRAREEASSSEVADAVTPERDPLAVRAEEILRSVRAFLMMGDLRSYDLLELGPPLFGSPLGGAGPALFRILDDRGRLAGSLHAELLRFEGSRSGRTVTLVLEDGYESHGGVRTPFQDGMRRIPVPFLDPEPWHEALPELFPPGAFANVEDDGRWDREALRRSLNDLFARDTSLGWYRVRGIGGVVGTQLTNLHLEVLDEGGRLSRRLFADRAWLDEEPPGMVLRMESGVILRGDRKEAFRNGRYDVYLPRARPAEWRAAGLPGLTTEGAETTGGTGEGGASPSDEGEVSSPGSDR